MMDGPEPAPGAPGAPGLPPTWTSSAKDAVGTALGASRVWFTVGHGILNEIYWPHVDHPEIRDLGFLVADDEGFWSEVKRDAERSVRLTEAGVPAVEASFSHERYELRLRICADAERDAILVEARLTERGPHRASPLRLYALLAPHLGKTGANNEIWVEAGVGGPVLLAAHHAVALALAAAPSPSRAGVGFVGVSDGWQDFARNGRMTWTHERAGEGNVAGMLELLPLDPATDGHGSRPRDPRSLGARNPRALGAADAPSDGAVTLVLAFAERPAQAANSARAALVEPFERQWQRYVAHWRGFQRGTRCPADLPPELEEEYRVSCAVIRTHEDRSVPGALVASLSIPWGQAGDQLGGYHLVWSRDLVESAGALVAMGDVATARRTLAYLVATQRPDGCWAQNQWLDGSPFWGGVQLDETAFPILLAGALRDGDALGGIDVLPMIRRAAAYLARTGPVTGEDRWEEDAGLVPSTLAPVIAGLVVAASFLDEPARTACLELADDWNAALERWTYAPGTSLAVAHGVAGHYLRVAAGDVLTGAPLDASVAVRNRPQGQDRVPATEMVSPDVLALVRFGLRRADDPRIVDTLRIVDALLRTDTPCGPVWHRYNHDGYGEHADGSPFDGTGIGRGWPLLVGERGHYALVAGEDPLPYLATMRAMAAGTGMLPEQVWDSDPIPERELLPGRPSGSAMPLVWAHAEYVKLCVSREIGHPVDRPNLVWERWQGAAPSTDRWEWRLAWPSGSMPAGSLLRITLLEPALVHWSADGWATTADVRTRDTGLGTWIADLPTRELPAGAAVRFTLYWTEREAWDGTDRSVTIVPARP